MLMMSLRKQEPDPYDPDQLMTLEQVARLLQLGHQTIRNHVATGKFPEPLTIGRSVRWRRKEVVEFLASLRSG